MKKLIGLAVFVVAVLVLASCKGHEKCPAYGKADVKTETPA